MFWELLNGLAQLNDKPWPSTVPRNIDTDSVFAEKNYFLSSKPLLTRQAHALCAGYDHDLPAKVDFLYSLHH